MSELPLDIILLQRLDVLGTTILIFLFIKNMTKYVEPRRIIKLYSQIFLSLRKCI